MILREIVLTIIVFVFVCSLAIAAYFADTPKGTVQPIDPPWEARP